jgi:hypothetical protein
MPWYGWLATHFVVLTFGLLIGGLNRAAKAIPNPWMSYKLRDWEAMEARAQRGEE